MASRQDQLHSYQFAVQRVVSALVTREAEAAPPPLRRLAAASLAGVLLAALSLAGAAVLGVFRPATDGWRADGAVIVERETGARYVLVDGALHPVANYASAVLIVGTRAHTVAVPASALRQVPRGTPLGIPGAPDSLPAPGDLLGLPWTLCSAGSAGAGPGTTSALYLGPAPTGGHRLGPDEAILGQVGDGTLYLLWHGTALAVPRPAVVRNAFSWGSEQPVPLAAALLDALPAGPDLAPPVIAGAGAPSAVPGMPVGTVVVQTTQGGTRQYAVVLPAGLAPVSQVQADLLLSDPVRAQKVPQRGARELAQGDYALLPQVAPATGPAGLPTTTPVPVHPGTAVCARTDAATGSPVLVTDAVPAVVAAPRMVPGDPPAAVLADRIAVPPGRGALVEAVPAPGAPAGTWCVVTDLGVRYPLAGPDVAARLGYPASAVVRVPSALVALLPGGPALDPDRARQPTG